MELPSRHRSLGRRLRLRPRWGLEAPAAGGPRPVGGWRRRGDRPSRPPISLGRRIPGRPGTTTSTSSSVCRRLLDSSAIGSGRRPAPRTCACYTICWTHSGGASRCSRAAHSSGTCPTGSRRPVRCVPPSAPPGLSMRSPTRPSRRRLLADLATVHGEQRRRDRSRAGRALGGRGAAESPPESVSPRPARHGLTRYGLL